MRYAELPEDVIDPEFITVMLSVTVDVAFEVTDPRICCRQEVQALLKAVADQMKIPTMFAGTCPGLFSHCGGLSLHRIYRGCSLSLCHVYFTGKPLTGARLASLLTQISTALNEGGQISVPSVYRAMEKEALDKIVAEGKKRFDKLIAQLKDGMPCM